MPVPDALEQSVAQVEGRLLALGEALGEHRAEAVETEAAELQRALATALEQLRRSARDGHLTLPLRQRLALASGRVAAQRESLARASAALDRAIDMHLSNLRKKLPERTDGQPRFKTVRGRGYLWLEQA